MNRSVAGLAFALLATACGLADDPQDERNKSVYPTFFDKTFEAYCIETFDLDGNGRISRYEAQRVRDVSCPGLGIVSLADLREFPNLERLDCSQNAITELDLSPCTRLVRLDCRGNGLVRLDVEGLRGLTEADCRDNALQQLDLTSNGWTSAAMTCGRSTSRPVRRPCRPTCAKIPDWGRSTAARRRESPSTEAHNCNTGKRTGRGRLSRILCAGRKRLPSGRIFL